jgi:hypothetical protein
MAEEKGRYTKTMITTVYTYMYYHSKNIKIFFAIGSGCFQAQCSRNQTQAIMALHLLCISFSNIILYVRTCKQYKHSGFCFRDISGLILF